VALLTTASSRVLLNGVVGCPIRHSRGLQQGDPLPPLLFVLAIGTLAQVLGRATSHDILHKLRSMHYSSHPSLCGRCGDLRGTNKGGYPKPGVHST
jgi:hypothetical protein